MSKSWTWWWGAREDTIVFYRNGRQFSRMGYTAVDACDFCHYLNNR